jgi:hypothetical protein
VALVAITVLALVAAGCGLEQTHGSKAVSLTVTRGFGSTQIGSISERSVPGSQTVLRMLSNSFQVTTTTTPTRQGHVQSIDGLAAGSAQLGWSYYVNGIAAPVGAAKTKVHSGDQIWWDLHDTTAASSVPAVVGSFPEPFVHGTGGKRLPTTLECGSDIPSACQRVSDELTSIGVPSARSLIGTGSGTDSLGVVVGSWNDVKGELVAGLIEYGPSLSGIYAKFASDGSSLELLDQSGHVVQTLTGDVGLIAATSQQSAEPTWLITGTDPAGVQAAANALAPGPLHNHFALAVKGSTDYPIPVQASTS